MSSTVDVNVLVHAANDADPQHDLALSTLTGLVEGPGRLHVFWPVLLGFVRIATHPRILPRPLPLSAALGNIDALLAMPGVRAHGELEDAWPVIRAAQLEVPSGGNDVPDAHLVALMRQHGVDTIYTQDRGFRRFDGIQVRRLGD